MERTWASFRRLSTAEEFLEFFEIPYDPAVVAVNRLHILKRFADYLAEAEGAAPAAADPEVATARYREALLRAYRDFLTGSALDYRLFKVLQDHAPDACAPRPGAAGAPSAGAGAGAAGRGRP